MQPRRAALALVALLALPLLAPPAAAAPPVAQGWTVDLAGAPANAGTALSLGFDGAGSQLLVGTTDRVALGGSDNDLVRVAFDQGNVSAEADASELVGEGRSSVAVSHDGKYALAGGNFTGSSVNGGANIYYYALPSLAPAWSKVKAEPVSVTALSGTGAVALVGTRNTSASAPGRLYRFDAGGTQLWDRAANNCGSESGTGGSFLSLDVSRDGRWVVAGTTFQGPEGPRGCILLFESNSLNPVLAYRVLTVNTGDVTAVDISANGAWFAAGTSGGAFYLFRNANPDRNTPLQDQLPALAPVRAVRVTEDGAGLVVADPSSVNRYQQTPGLLTLQWTAPVSNLRSLDTTPDGDYIVVGEAQLRAFHASGNQTLWGVDVANALVRVAQAGPNDVRIAAASGTAVRGYRLHWALEVRKTEPEPLALTLGQARPYTLELVNTGSAVDTFQLSAGASGFLVDVAPPTMLLRPGERGNTTVTVTPQPNAEANLYRIQVTARGQRSGVDHPITLNATVGAVPRLGLGLVDPSFGDRGVYQGESHDIVFEVRNSGNARLEVSYNLSQAPNVGGPWDATLSRTSGFVDAGGVTTNTLSVVVPFEARNGTENFLNVSVRGEGAEAHVAFRLVVNPFFTAAIDVLPPSRVVAPGKSISYNVVVANNGTLREEYRLVYCVALPDLIPCIGNATLGLGGWSVALDTSPFILDRGQSKSFNLAVAAPRGAIPNVDKLALQVEVVASNPDHRLRDTRLVLTAVQEEAPRPTPGRGTPGFEPLLALAGLGLALALRRR